MKKFLICIVIALCILSMLFVSCGKKKNKDTDTDVNNSNVDTNITDTDTDQNQGDTQHSHSFGDWKTSKEPNCESDGEKYRECSCGQKETESVPMKGHTYKDNVCTVCGTVKGSEGIKYTLSGDGSHYFVHKVDECTDKDIIITNRYNGKPVKRIEEMAFFRCESVETVTIAEGIEEISAFAFGGCTNLKTVKLPNSLKTINEIAFLGCNSLKTVELGNGVITIGESAFRGCVNLESIVIPESVVSVGKDAFEGCSKLTVYCKHQTEQIWQDNWNGGSEVVWGQK